MKENNLNKIISIFIGCFSLEKPTIKIGRQPKATAQFLFN
jgi:hypothetical protein